MELWQQVRGAFDGAGHELREEAHERGEADEVPLAFHATPVEINAVAHGLEREEGDAQREMGGRGGRPDHSRRDGTDQEPRIFVVQQGQHVRRDSERQHPFARDWVLLAIDETPEAVICSRRGQDDGGVPTFADEIEEDAENGIETSKFKLLETASGEGDEVTFKISKK